MSPRELIRDQRGTTLTELLVGMAAGMVVLFALTTLVVVTLNSTTRVSARVDATQLARLSLNKVVDQLHSACIAPKAPPIRSGSTDTELRFVHATGAAAVPTPVLSVITFSGDTLIQSDYDWVEGAAPFWVFEETPSRTVQLAEGVVALASQPVFSYYGYAEGAVSTTPLPVPLSEYDASRTIHVTVAFKSDPKKGRAEDGKPAHIQGGATLRLSASSYNPAAPSLPCQ